MKVEILTMLMDGFKEKYISQLLLSVPKNGKEYCLDFRSTKTELLKIHNTLAACSKLIHFISLMWHTGCVNLSFAYVEGESLLMAMKDVALSSGRSVY